MTKQKIRNKYQGAGGIGFPGQPALAPAAQPVTCHNGQEIQGLIRTKGI
jgi:hypothetical protein